MFMVDGQRFYILSNFIDFNIKILFIKFCFLPYKNYIFQFFNVKIFKLLSNIYKMLMKNAKTNQTCQLTKSIFLPLY